MNLTPEEKEVGRENYHDAVTTYNETQRETIEAPADPSAMTVDEVTRRDFLRGVVATGAAGTLGLGAMYFGYKQPRSPVRIGIIGTGDEGGILIGALNPNYVDVVAIADIRPSSIHRALHGDYGGGDPLRTHTLRPGLMQKYGWKTEDEARRHVKVYDAERGGYEALLADPNVEGVIISLPLFLHCHATVAAMKAGKHVLTEKLMAHNVAQCKVMGEAAASYGKLLATGHQRHYNILYDNAVHLIRWGVLGQIHHIRAQWHRGNLPGRDSWAPPIPGGQQVVTDGQSKHVDAILDELNRMKAAGVKDDVLLSKISQWEAWNADQTVEAKRHGYQDLDLNGRQRTALEELVRWRLWDRTGGGLMAELGSHQLDAASIFVSALGENGKKVHPLSVHAIGGRQIFPRDRDADDHVYCMFEFPGPEYDPNFDVGYRDRTMNYPPPEGIPPYEVDHNKKIVVTYSSINGNGFGGYGEIVMGTKGSLVLEREQEAMLYSNQVAPSTRVGVKNDDGPVLDTQESGYGAVAKAAETAPVSRGYAEEIEHWAWCIRNPSPENQPRCNPEVALADAVLALTAKQAIHNGNSGKGGFIEFDEQWFDIQSDATPDGSSKAEERENLKSLL